MAGLWNTLAAAAKLLTEVRVGYLVAALGVYGLSVVIVAARWRSLLGALGCPAGMWETLLIDSASVSVGNVTPARTLGCDACRFALIRSRGRASLKAATASILYDRGSELPALAVLVLLAVPTIQPAPTTIVIAAALVVGVATAPIRRVVTARIRTWHFALIGVHVERRVVAAAIASSMLFWFQDAARMMLVAAAFRTALTPSQAATLTVIRLATGVVPLPGGIGVVEGGLIAGLLWFRIPIETATAITILERAILYGCGTCLGAASLLLLGGRRILEKRAQVEGHPSAGWPSALR